MFVKENSSDHFLLLFKALALWADAFYKLKCPAQIGRFLFGSGVKSPNKKHSFFLLILPYKTRWKPQFLMD